LNEPYDPEAAVPTVEAKSYDIPTLSEEVPFSHEPAVIISSCLLTLAILTACYFTAEIILPIVMAFLLKLLLQPPMRFLERWYVPRSLAAFLIILAVFGVVVAGVAALSGPATAWAEKLPEGIPRLEEKMQFLSGPISALQTFLHQFDGKTSNAPDGLDLTAILFRGTQHLASEILETILVLFFLLASGDTFLRRFVEILPKFKDKRQVVALSQQIEENITAYLSTISAMNALVGVATAMAMWACGLGDPFLWGGIAFLLNYIPIMGPIAGIGLFLFAGLLKIDALFWALMPAAPYLAIHLVEGEIATPMLLARRFTLNPVLVVVSLIFWFWMWGAPGAILAVPFLAITKIICDGVRPLNAIGHFLEG
jgi:predicted PurR-regulated permease PerM